jgi:hypothetical protein
MGKTTGEHGLRSTVGGSDNLGKKRFTHPGACLSRANAVVVLGRAGPGEVDILRADDLHSGLFQAFIKMPTPNLGIPPAGHMTVRHQGEYTTELHCRERFGGRVANGSSGLVDMLVGR